jgi:hypothetical protein
VQRIHASLHHKTNHGPHPPSPDKLSKTQTKVNLLAFAVCGLQYVVAMQQTNLNMLQMELLGTHTRMGYISRKDDIKTYSLCILILFGGNPGIISRHSVLILLNKVEGNSNAGSYQNYQNGTIIK